PAGIVNVPMWVGIRRMALPMIRYRMNPTEERLRAMVEPLLSTWDDDWAHYMGDSMRDFVLDLRIPPVAKDSELLSLSMPVLAFGADDDISFPGQKMLPRLRALVPHVQTEMLSGCKHCPPTDAAFQQHFANRIVEFLA
ncbi:MAG TPA: alpha/beta hydrolase, partial [Verrucomicrobium sp.]|nr:alpha/beta hydrolase [Verrucomicrobium sp.]